MITQMMKRCFRSLRLQVSSTSDTYITYLLGSPIDRGLLLFPADPLGRTYAVQKSIKSSGLYRDGVHPFKGFGSDQ